RPLTLFFGENNQGKSSAVNGLEWALYGDECCGKDTGIRERIGWEIPNRHLDSSGVFVELELTNGGGTYTVRRSLTPRGRRGGMQEELTLFQPDGTELTGNEAS